MKEEEFSKKRIRALKQSTIKHRGMDGKEIKRLNAIQRMQDLRLEHEKEMKKKEKESDKK